MDFRECESLTTVPEMSAIMGDLWATNSSSSSFQHPFKYDVYFSFRGEDTRRTFTTHLYKALCDKGIDAFTDEQLEKGEEISPALIKAREQSRISIIIFSPNYASSSWCLDELVKIMENKKTHGQLVIPVFYKVDPSAVRRQTQRIGQDLIRHEARFGPGSERIQRWRWALNEAANLSGWHLAGFEYEFEFVQRITENVIGRLNSFIAEAGNLRRFQGPASQNRNFTYSAELPGEQFTGFKFESLSSLDFRECEFLTTIPDISGAQNLTKLMLDFCINLVEIHDTVGFLGKLVTLSARHCWKLERFPRKIRLISLQHLNLHGNYSFKFFPEVLGKMENIREVSLQRTAIEDLPYSMGKLSGLRILELNYCRIRNLPRSIGMLTNVTEISMAFCPLVFQSLKRNINFGKLRYCSVKKLNLKRCDLLDEDLPMIVHHFPNTKYLDLSENKFASISACIIELYYLEKLYLANCKLLEEIEEIPPNLVLLSATNCNRLTSESTNMLGLAHQESSDKRFEVKLPGTRIPECFNYSIGEGKMSFWVHQKFPNVALCLAFELEDKETLEGSFYFTCDIWIQVNRRPFLQLESYREFRTSHHVRLIHLHSYIDDFKNVDKLEWNHVEILWEVKYYLIRLNVMKPGRVHIYGKETDMKNITFRKDKIPSSVPSDGGCSFSQPTNDHKSETYDSQGRGCSFSQTTFDDESETYDYLGGDGKRKPCYQDREEDLSILLFHCSRNDPVTLVCGNICTRDDDFFSCDQISSIPDRKCSTRGQGNEPGTIWDPMEMEYQLTCQKDQRNNGDRENDELMGSNQENQWRFSFCALISSLVLLCSSSSLNSP